MLAKENYLHDTGTDEAAGTLTEWSPLSVTSSGRRLFKCQTTSLEGEGEGARYLC